MDEATARHVLAWARYVRLCESVGEAARALGDGARLAPLKGLWLCASGLAHPAERPMKDADLLLVGASLEQAAHRLRRAGFVLADVPRAEGVLSMRLDDASAPWLDLHARPLPRGLGHLTTAALLAGARVDGVTVAGAELLLARPAPMLVQLVGNVLKDRVFEASAHGATDLEAALGAEPGVPAEAARALSSAGLVRGGALVCRWARTFGEREGLARLASELERLGAPADDADRLLGRLRRISARAPGLGRVLVRALADRPADRIVAVSAAVALNALHPLRVRRLRRRLGG